MRVLHDNVYNHMANDAVLAQLDYRYWFHLDTPRDENFGAKLNYTYIDPRRNVNPAQEYALASMTQWVQLFHLDGIRFDYARAIPFDALHSFRACLRERAVQRHFFAIAESLPENPAIVGPNGPLDAAWSQNLMKQLISTAIIKPYRDQQPLNMAAIARAFDWRVTGYTDAHDLIIYSESHDEPHLLYLFDENLNVAEEARFLPRQARGSFITDRTGDSYAVDGTGIWRSDAQSKWLATFAMALTASAATP